MQTDIFHASNKQKTTFDIPCLRKTFANKEVEGLHLSQLDSLADNPHKLSHRNFSWYQKLPFAQRLDVRPRLLLNNDLQHFKGTQKTL